MRYRDLARDRFKDPPSHPILAEVTIDPVDWFRFQQLDEDNPATRILGHDISGARMTVYVACVSEEVRIRLEDGWC